jgi:hypothetical protein
MFNGCWASNNKALFATQCLQTLNVFGACYLTLRTTVCNVMTNNGK